MQDITRCMKHRIVIIGAGPTALGVAHRLYELGIMNTNTQIIILEQQDIAGGLAASQRDEKGFLWDMGGHVVFSHFKYFDKVLDEAVPDWNKRTRAAFAFMMGSSGNRTFIPYPVQDNIHIMDEKERMISLDGLQAITDHPIAAKPDNFDQWLLKNFGEGLCNVFMRRYNQKVWTVPPTEMNSVWVGERVAVPNVDRIKEKIAALGKLEQVKDSSDWGPNHFFRFPRYGGTGGIWNAVYKQLPKEWFHFKHSVTRISANEKELQVMIDGDFNKQYKLDYDTLVSTAPLDMLLDMNTDSDSDTCRMRTLASELVYSHTHVIGIGLKGQPPEFLSDKSWIYFPDSDSPFYRVTIFSNYSNDHVPIPGLSWSLMCESAEPKTVIDTDYWSARNIVNETVNALIRYGFIRQDQVVSRYHRRLHHGYPVPSLNRESILKSIQPWLQSNSIYSRGRFGGWRYEVGNQDHSFMQGVELADLLARGTPEETYPDPNWVNAMKSSKRILEKTPSVDVSLEVVVSHYAENLNWLLPEADVCHVYHKGNYKTPDFRFKHWEVLPNVGRESHTYLHHIITNYDRLANATIFIQGEQTSHLSYCYPFSMFDQYYNEALTHGYSAKCKRTISSWGKVRHIKKWKAEYNSGLMEKTDDTFGEFWLKIFKTPHPTSITMCWNGCFAVSKKRIRERPKEFYENIMSYLKNHPNPETGHYIERMWTSIFS